MHVIAAKAVALKEAMTDEFKAYQTQIVRNAKKLSNELVERGIRLVSGGTDNHLMLVDLSDTGRTGKEVEALLDRAHITANKNAIPFDKQSPFITSGLRLGTPAVTSRGMKEADMVTIAECIADIVKNGEEAIDRCAAKVAALCKKYPIYANDVIR